jgi:alanine dehydrogenase
VSAEPVWIAEADVVAVLSLGEAIDALERGLALEAEGGAVNMPKTQVNWPPSSNLHALGGVMPGKGLVGTKTWSHTANGTCPLLVLFDAGDGTLRAIIEAFALGQMRTGAMTGLATRWLAQPDARELAIIGTGKQAIAQVAAVHAVRPLARLRIYSPRPESRAAFADKVRAAGFGFEVAVAESLEAAVDGADIVTLVTRAKEPLLGSKHLPPGTHVNAVGAIGLDRVEFDPQILRRCGSVVVDSVDSVRRLSREFIDFYGAGHGDWASVRTMASVVQAKKPRSKETDLTLFKSMGMGISDLAIGSEVLERARARGLGRPLQQPRKAAPRLL